MMSYGRLLIASAVMALLGFYAMFRGETDSAVSLFSAGLVLQGIMFSLEKKK